MGQLWAYLFPPPPEPAPPLKSLDRWKNFVVENGRGAFGSIPIIILLIILLSNPEDLKKKGNTIFMVCGGYLQQMLNVCGWDKRFATWMIYGDIDTAKLSNVKLLMRVSFTSYFLTMISSGLHLAPYLMELVVGSMNKTAAIPGAETTKKKRQEILALAISSSASIGSAGMVISARNIMFMRSIWEMNEQPDTFNFMDFFLFAFPVTLVMFGLNLGYYIILIRGKLNMDEAEIGEYRNVIADQRNSIPKSLTNHEKLVIFFTCLTYLLYFTRWSNVLKKIAKVKGWADFETGKDETGNTKIPDVTIAALTLVVCSIMPHTFNWVKVWKAKKIADLPPDKPDTAVLSWRIVDKNTNYGHMFLVGAFCALDLAMRKSTNFAPTFLHNSLAFITKSSRPVGVLIWCILGCLLSNIMTSVGAVGMLTVIVLNAYKTDDENDKHLYQFVLASGLSTGFGLLAWFQYTPGFQLKYLVPHLTQMKYSLASVLICLLVMWLGIAFYAPLIFEEN
ncbi:hypothetical protein O0L34_g16075 [Tuta absoluta]|nr:hypothetical protein O0L34_g16075 [Tuta absoluta]